MIQHGLNCYKRVLFGRFRHSKLFPILGREKSYMAHHCLCQKEVSSLSYDGFCVRNLFIASMRLYQIVCEYAHKCSYTQGVCVYVIVRFVDFGCVHVELDAFWIYPCRAWLNHVFPSSQTTVESWPITMWWRACCRTDERCCYVSVVLQRELTISLQLHWWTDHSPWSVRWARPVVVAKNQVARSPPPGKVCFSCPIEKGQQLTFGYLTHPELVFLV